MPKTATAVDIPTPATEGHHRYVSIADVCPSALNPRKKLREDSILELANSIRIHGIIQPLVVRVRQRDGGPVAGYELVAGWRRWTAAQRAGLTEVPVIVRSVTDTQLLELALQENVHRADMTPLEEARALEALRVADPIYRADAVAAGKIGRSETYVRDRLKLLRLEPIVQDALENEAITASHAERIARLPKDQHRLALEACFNGFWLSEQFIGDARRKGVTAASDAGEWAALRGALETLRHFDQWLETHGKVDVAAPDVQQLLVADAPTGTFEDEADPLEQVVALPQLSAAYVGSEAKQLGVLSSQAWKELKGKKAHCEYARQGVIVLGLEPGEAPRIVTFCSERRKCEKHWPKPTTERRAAPAVDWKAQEEKRRREEAEWNAVKGQLFEALVAKTKGIKLTAKLVVMALRTEASYLERTFGVRLSDATAVQVLALSTVRTNYLQYFRPDAERFGVDVAGILRRTKAEARPAAKTAKPKKGGRRG